MTDQPGILRFGVFEVHLAAGELRKNGSRVKLQEQPFQVLVTLLKRPGEIVTREELKEKLWAGDTFVDFDHSLSTAVNKIREVLGDSATSPRFIETVPRKGYRFVGGAAIAQGSAVEVSSETPAATIGSPQGWAWAFGGAVLVALAVFGVSKWQGQSPQSSVPTGPTPFTSLRGSEERPAFSPDGSRVAFSWSGEAGDNVDIYVQVVGSSHRLRLTDDPAFDETPSWSPDGRQIAFVRISSARQAIYLTSSVSGPARKVTEFSDPPLGIDMMRGHPQGGLAWAPDGKSILFCERAPPGEIPSIFRLFLETGKKKRLTFPPAEMVLGDAFPAVSPDGGTLAVARGTHDKRLIYLVPLEGGEPRELTSQGSVFGLAWTADSREIVYAQRPVHGSAQGVWRIPVSGGPPRPVPEAGQDVQFPAISLPGKRLVYERVGFDSNIWMYSLPGAAAGQSPRQVIASTYSDNAPRLSPDGNRIVFVSSRTGVDEIWVCDRDGRNLVQLTSFGREAGSPRWSPDGRHIAFDASLRGNWDMFVVDAQGGAARQLTSYEGLDARPSWSHDARWIYFASYRSGTLQIWKVSVDGGEAVQVTQGGGLQPFESPDGRFLYFARTVSGAGIWRMPVEGGQEVAVHDTFPKLSAEANWDVAENGIYAVVYKGTSISAGKWFLQLLPFDATEPVDVMEVPAWAGATPLDIAPDGKWFAYAQVDRTESDLMLMENFE